MAAQVSCSAMILAASGEDRMRSSRPAPVHLLCGRPMVQYVLDALDATPMDRIVVVVGAGAEQVAKKIAETAADPRLVLTEASRGRGNAEAALAGLEIFSDDLGDDDLLVLPGNMPLLGPAMIADLVAHHRDSAAAATVLAVPAAPASGRRRLIDAGSADTIVGIDAPNRDPGDQRWCDAGVYCFRRSLLAPAIRRLRPEPETGRFMLHGVIDVLAQAGHPVTRFALEDETDTAEVDDRVQLAMAEAVIRQRTNLRWMRRGVTMVDPGRTYIDTTVSLASDVTLFPGTMLQGATTVGPGAEIGPDTRLVDCAVGARARVEKAMGRDAEVGEDAVVGPFAVLEPGSHVPPASVTGPFHHAND